MRRSKSLTPTERQRRWRAKKRKAEVKAGLRPKRKRPKSAAEVKRAYRAKLKRKAEAAKYAATRERRRLARGDGDGSIELRIGRAQDKLADIADNSVALILTDLPYPKEADLLYEWLAHFAMRTLVPGGSLICFTGHTRVFRDHDTFRAAGLKYLWLMTLLHDQARTLPGLFVIPKHKPILWFVKGHRRNKNAIVDVLTSAWRNKDGHPWGQGEGGIAPIVERLTCKGELVVDPFCGTGEWGEICASLGCRWIGCDIVEGGSDAIAT